MLKHGGHAKLLTPENEYEENSELVHCVTQDVLEHGARNQRTRAAIRFALQQVFGGHLGGQRQRRKRVHDEVDPEHLHSLKWIMQNPLSRSRSHLERSILNGACANECDDDRNDVDSELELKNLAIES